MTQSPRVDYDKVASTYDGRAQGAQEGYLSEVTTALQDLACRVNARRILDLGCGTGRSLQGLADSLSPSPICYGLDLSEGMLAEARRLDPDYRLVRAAAELPPFSPSSFDLVFCVHAFHHFPDKPHVVQSAYDVLKPGGAFAIVNFDPRECNWYIYDYFEGTYETDLKRFPALAEQEEMLRRVGFGEVGSPLVENIDSSLVGEVAFGSYYLRKDACSQFIILSDDAYQAGLARMRTKIAEAKARGESVVFHTQLRNRMCHGFKRT